VEIRLTSDRIPARYLGWLASSRLKFLKDLIDGKPMRYFSAHLPVMATWPDANNNGGGHYPVNMTVKGIGLVPGEESLSDFTDIFEGVIAQARTMPWEESLVMRIDAVAKLYGEVGHFDSTVLGGLEIFEGSAIKNVRENPQASLLYVGMTSSEEGMQYISFQVNGKVEILEKDNPYYRFLLASRKLFEFDKFHIFQPDYPFGYLIRVREVKDKSPWSRELKRPD